MRKPSQSAAVRTTLPCTFLQGSAVTPGVNSSPFGPACSGSVGVRAVGRYSRHGGDRRVQHEPRERAGERATHYDHEDEEPAIPVAGRAGGGCGHRLSNRERRGDGLGDRRTFDLDRRTTGGSEHGHHLLPLRTLNTRGRKCRGTSRIADLWHLCHAPDDSHLGSASSMPVGAAPVPAAGRAARTRRRARCRARRRARRRTPRRGVGGTVWRSREGRRRTAPVSVSRSGSDRLRCHLERSRAPNRFPGSRSCAGRSCRWDRSPRARCSPRTSRRER